MFSLYFNRKDKKLVIETLKPSSFMYSKCTDKVTRFNDCHFMCTDRKLLREKANEIKNNWIKEIENELKELNSLKVKTKY